MMSLRHIFILPLLILIASPVWADDLDVDLSKPDVRLDVSFKGSELLLFGAKDLYGDVIVVVRGPPQNTSIRLKKRVLGVWVNTDEVIFANTPTFYALATSKPVEDLLDEDTLMAERIGISRLGLKIKKAPDQATPQSIRNFTDGLIRNMIAKNLFTGEPGVISLVGKQLFRTDLWFPANISVGQYTVDTYLIVKGRIENKRTTHLQVHKVGIEAKIYNFAHENAIIYGFLAIIIAIISGWTANAVFMRRGR